MVGRDETSGQILGRILQLFFFWNGFFFIFQFWIILFFLLISSNFSLDFIVYFFSLEFLTISESMIAKMPSIKSPPKKKKKDEKKKKRQNILITLDSGKMLGNF